MDIYIRSKDVHIKKGETIRKEHRLSLNTEGIDTHKLTFLIIEKCEAIGLPYHLKYSENAERDDTIVVYSDTKRLPQYLAILKEIAQENQDIRKRCYHPPVLTGVIDDWIGYGTEPALSTNGKFYSFNQIRARIIENGIENAIIEWLQNHKNCQVNYQGEIIYLTEFLAKVAAGQESLRLKNNLEYQKSKNQTKEELENYYGYNEKEIETPKIKEYLERAIQKEINHVLNLYISKQKENFPPIILPMKNNKELIIYQSDLIQSIDTIVPMIMKTDPNFKQLVKKKIQEESAKENIDIDKYCFNKDTKEKLLEQDRTKDSMKDFYQKLSVLAKNKEIVPSREKAINESESEYLKYLKEFYHKRLEPGRENPKKVNSSRNQYQAMSEEEIKASQEKIALHSLNTRTNEKEKKTLDRLNYTPMTEEEIKNPKTK